MAPLFNKLFSGELSLGDLWAQHPGSEHRPLLPRIFLLLMGPLADFNIVTIMYVTQLCLLATFVCIFIAYRETVGVSSKSLFFAVPISLLVFNFGQYWNMFNAWSIHVVVVNSFGVLSFLLLNKLRGEGRRKTLLLFLVSMLSGSAATLSAGHGLLVWPVGLMQLFLEPIPAKRKRYFVTVWTLIGIVHWAVYFWDYASPAVKVTDRYFFNSSTLGVEYFLGLIGFAITTEPELAVATGFVIGTIVAFVISWVIKNREQARYTFWISLLGFSALTLVATTVGRGGEGLGTRIDDSKYVTFSVLLTLSAYVMALKLARDHGPSRILTLPVGVCAILVILSVPLSYYSGVQEAESLRIEREKEVLMVLNYENVSNKRLAQELRPMMAPKHPRIGNHLRHNIAIFDDLNYTVFAKLASEISPTGRQSKH